MAPVEKALIKNRHHSKSIFIYSTGITCGGGEGPSGAEGAGWGACGQIVHGSASQQHGPATWVLQSPASWRDLTSTYIVMSGSRCCRGEDHVRNGWFDWQSSNRDYFCVHSFLVHIALLTVQCRQVYCLVDMSPSAPSWRPPRQWVEFDGFPGRRERPNQWLHTMMVSGRFNIPNSQRKSQKKNSTIRSVPKPAKPTVPCIVSRKAVLEQNFNQPQQQQSQPCIQRMAEQANWYPIVHWNPQPNFAEKNELNRVESNFSKRKTRNRLLGADIATDQTKPFNPGVSSKKP
jgi:hypothetical protein